MVTTQKPKSPVLNALVKVVVFRKREREGQVKREGETGSEDAAAHEEQRRREQRA
jgi:hypothetical protein